jgi:DNA-binding winged helix-turn-helix (wHTH) protein
MDEKSNGANTRPEDVLIEALLQATGKSSGAVYEFSSRRSGEAAEADDTFRLDVADGRLLREGQVVSLAPKEFDTLRLLVERHGRLVTKQDLLDRVWAGTFVGDDTIAQRISVLRKALGDAGTSAKYIETVPKRGYRFIAEVRVVNAQ